MSWVGKGKGVGWHRRWSGFGGVQWDGLGLRGLGWEGGGWAGLGERCGLGNKELLWRNVIFLLNYSKSKRLSHKWQKK